MQPAQPEQGYIIMFVGFLIVAIMTAIAFSMNAVILTREAASLNSQYASQSYYAAEAGVEDAMLRLRNNPTMSGTSYTMTVGAASASVLFPDLAAGSRTITSQASENNINKTILATVTLAPGGNAFYYGIQANGGVVINGNSTVNGNVFSAGAVSGAGTVTGSVAGVGTSGVSGITIGANATAYSCQNARIGGNFVKTGGTSSGCTIGGTSTTGSQLSGQSLPITASQISDYEAQASAGTIINGPLSISNGANQSLGPAKIIGNLTIANSSTLTLTGPLYVTGTLFAGNSSVVKMSPSYNSSLGVIIVDGIITLSNTSSFQNSGVSNTYLAAISNSTNATAISVSNSVSGIVLEASAGGISLGNNSNLHEIAAAGTITLGNNATINYDIGAISNVFNSGPGGSLKVTSWMEP